MFHAHWLQNFKTSKVLPWAKKFIINKTISGWYQSVEKAVKNKVVKNTQKSFFFIKTVTEITSFPTFTRVRQTGLLITWCISDLKSAENSEFFNTLFFLIKKAILELFENFAIRAQKVSWILAPITVFFFFKKSNSLYPSDQTRVAAPF